MRCVKFCQIRLFFMSLYRRLNHFWLKTNLSSKKVNTVQKKYTQNYLFTVTRVNTVHPFPPLNSLIKSIRMPMNCVTWVQHSVVEKTRVQVRGQMSPVHLMGIKGAV